MTLQTIVIKQENKKVGYQSVKPQVKENLYKTKGCVFRNLFFIEKMRNSIVTTL
jgi:hypothetical protein